MTAFNEVERILSERRSTRAFLQTPVARATVEELLDAAARAPSGTNMQPWRCHVLAGDRRRALSQALVAAHAEGPGAAELDYYPAPAFEPYLSRRRTLGRALYGLLGIERGDHAAMHAQHARNLVFFDAPVGLIFTIDRRLKVGSWLDYGMFLQSFMLAARARGLATCAQAAFAPYHAVIRQHIPATQSEIVVCGMSLGYADDSAPENRLTTDREPARRFATFLGFD
ncbi:MAG: nitroreductase [Methylobacteriaceae bacterium]|nr:nitroreductase [Methylobacteriaceae bacterium]